MNAPASTSVSPLSDKPTNAVEMEKLNAPLTNVDGKLLDAISTFCKLGKEKISAGMRVSPLAGILIVFRVCEADGEVRSQLRMRLIVLSTDGGLLTTLIDFNGLTKTAGSSMSFRVAQEDSERVVRPVSAGS